MANVPNKEKEQFWQQHIVKYKQSNLSLKAYCKSQGFSPSSFNYWLQKVAAKTSSRSNFLPVVVSTPPANKAVRTGKTLPDPRWVAEVIFELHARLQ